MLINYIGAHRTFARVSYSDVLLKRIPKDYFKDKIVLIGTSALGLGDLRATPLSHSSPGVEIHATVLHNILNGEFIIRTRWFTTLGLILFLSVFISVISSSVRPIPSIVTTLAIICAFLFSAYLLFTYRNVWIEVVRPVYAIFFSYVVTGVQRYVGEESLKRRIKGMFSRFVPEGVVSRLVEERSQDILLSGKKEDLTVLISDIRDFTSMSHRMEPEKVVSMLNRYFSAMTDVIFRHGGTIDKFMGDSVMAIFGAPVPLKDHAFMATKAALEMKKSMAELNRQWMLSGGARLDIGIGINTGEMIVGFVGSETRLDYTVIGDNVNIAARLEPLSRKYNTTIIIGPKTYERIKDRAIVKDLGKIKLRGIEERLSIYAVLDVKTG
jgi:adenylate cyclase